VARRIQLAEDDTIWVAEIDGARVTVTPGPATFTVDGDERDGFTAQGPDGAHPAAAAIAGDAVWVSVDGEVFEFRLIRGSNHRGVAGDHDVLSPPMSATVVRVAVTPGDRVRAGDLLVALEAMKMELPIRAPRDAVVRAVHCAEGDLVQPGSTIIEID
jgi:3-methylcrotonyl-CoA carboxylase alpha subunit